MNQIPHYILVTPVWNDSDRLAVFGPKLAKALKEFPMNVTWVVADDGSSVEERLRLDSLLGEFAELYSDVRIIHRKDRSRKGGAIKAAWEAYPEAGFYCFVDGDGAISPAEILRLMHHASEQYSDEISFVAVRQSGTIGNVVERTWLRNLLFRGFSALMHCLLKEPWLDTQCGAKVIHGAAYRSIRDSLVESGFVFDAELLTHLSHAGFAVREMPISWQEVPGSKLSLLADSCRILFGLVRIRARLKKM